MAAVGRLVLMLLSQVWSTRALGMDGYILAMAWYQDCILYSHGPLVADRNCDHQLSFLMKVLEIIHCFCRMHHWRFANISNWFARQW